MKEDIKKAPALNGSRRGTPLFDLEKKVINLRLVKWRGDAFNLITVVYLNRVNRYKQTYTTIAIAIAKSDRSFCIDSFLLVYYPYPHTTTEEISFLNDDIDG